jgi:hypothetical protein
MSRTRKVCGIAVTSFEIESGSPGAPFDEDDCNSAHIKKKNLKLEHKEFQHTHEVCVYVCINQYNAVSQGEFFL